MKQREHLHDDRWFHSNPAFDDVTGELTRRIRAAFPEHRRMRASFIAHILLEMLLDASLDQRGRVTFDAYYALERMCEDAWRWQQRNPQGYG